ncbi:MAG: FAD-binding oxidoreductase, partial [Anaerolineales bacterium]
MQKNAKLVIIGAGIVGTSAAYHLSELGWRDIVVLDQGPLYETGGSTSHAPGLVFQTNSSKMMTEFAKYTVELFNGLEYQGEPCWYSVGGVEVAYTKDRWQDLKRKHGWSKSYNLESHLITPDEVKEMIPIINPDVIQGGYYVPSDGDARAWQAAAVLAEMTEVAGTAKYFGDTQVTDIEMNKGRVKTVVTDKGRIDTEFVLLCTNIWAPVLAGKVGVDIPLMSVEHQYLISDPLPEL